ncbi:hypothetical protein [Thermomonospora cellulosilytica]|uniref:Lipoprotein n=1 Tax=Thermomonospora cellulosilytica TaxID=1411118 RepID=A0A7W3N417_9ACTN|nr:hypothetical protein [Thermomonospora cellulosilytica]MBA9007145.1 hypothetical protein [Thermomonospora cellulosilytica]
MRKARWISGGLAALSLGALCASCSSGDSSGAGPAPESAGRLSFEQFPEYKVELLNYAHVKLTAECMKQAGYPQLAQAGVPEPDRARNLMRITPARFGPPDEAHARRYGFGYEWNSPAQPPSVVSFDKSFDKSHERCQEDAWRKIGPSAKRLYSSINDLSNKLITDYGRQLQAHPEWTRLNKALLSCLAESGYRPVATPGGGAGPGKEGQGRDPGAAGAPASSAGQPEPRSFGVRLGFGGREESWRPTPRRGTVQVGPAIPARAYVPTAEEVKFAVVYAECNQSTGRTRTLTEISRKLQDEVMRRHETEFTELTATLDTLVTRAATLIGRT